MSKDLLQKAKHVVASARAKGANGVRVSVGRNRNSRVEWRNDDLERIRESTTMQVSLTLFVDGRYSSHGTSDLRPDALEKFIEDAVGMTRLLQPDPHRKLPDPSRYADMFTGDLGNYDPSGARSMTGTQRRRHAQALVESARSAPGGEKIVSAYGSWSDVQYESCMVASNGMEGENQGTAFYCYALVSVGDEDGRKPRDYAFTGGLHLDRLEPLEVVGRRTTERALAQVGARPVKTGRYPCVVENRVCSTPLGGLLGPIHGNAIQQQNSFMVDKLDEQVASPVLTITDEPHLVGGFESSRFDGEGMATRRRTVFENGVLRTFYLSTYHASKLEMEPTSGGYTNLLFPAGTRDLDGLLRAMGTGILITDFRGGNSNSATGDFSAGVTGFWVEDGRRIHPLNEMNVGGNHLELWKQLAELGNDPYRYDGIRCPSMRFNELQFSGV